MAIEIVGHVDGHGTGSTPRTLVPVGGTAVGDLLVAVFAANDQSITPPSGWTPFRDVDTGTLRTGIFVHIREVGETTYDFTPAASVTDTHTLITIRGWGLGSGAAGPDGIRSVTGTNTTNVAPSMTADVADSLVVVISTERTSAAETDVSSIVGATPLFFVPGAGVGLETISISSLEVSVPGSTGNVTITYPNIQAANGYAIQFLVTPSDDPPPPDASNLYIGSDQVTAAFLGEHPILRIYAGADLVQTFDATPAFTVSDLLADPQFQIAHRGLGGSYPEQSMEGYDAAVLAGFMALEVSVQVTSDGVFVLSHDPDPSRVFGEPAIPFADQTWVAVSGFESATGPILRLEELLDKYAASHVIFLDDKTNAHTAELLAMAATYPNPTSHFVWKGFRGWSPAADQWTALGYETWGIYSNGEVDLTPNYFDKFSLLGLNYNASSAQWATILAAGKRVVAHVIGNDGNRLEGAANGATGFMTTNLSALP